MSNISLVSTLRQALPSSTAVGDPLERALAIVDLYRTYAEEDGFHGCAFVNAGAELAADHPARRVIVDHKRRTLERWEELLGALGVAEPRRLATECSLLLEGAYVQSGVGLGDGPLDIARDLIVRRLAETRDEREGPHGR